MVEITFKSGNIENVNTIGVFIWHDLSKKNFFENIEIFFFKIISAEKEITFEKVTCALFATGCLCFPDLP
jgi:hypothetical protein